MKTPIKKLDYINTGIVDWEEVNNNFTDISDDIANLNTRLLRQENALERNVVTYLLETEGYTTVLRAKEHDNTKLVHAFIQAADNVKETVTIHILKGNRDIAKPQTIKSTEKSGKAQNFSLYKTQVISKVDNIKLYTNGNRKVIVTLVFSNYDVK